METRRDGVESQLLSYIRDAQEEYDKLIEKEAEITERRSVLADTIDSLKTTLQFHLAKAGKEDKGITSEFAPITSIREAVHIALQKYGEMDKQQLRDILQGGGFKFGNKNPIRSIHFALVGDPWVTITEGGKYQWVENGKPKVTILSIPKGVIKFFVVRDNAPASLPEVLEGIKTLGVRTTAKDLKGNVEWELESDKMEITEEGKYRLKHNVFEAMKALQD